jgi:hypothetical protein
VRAADAQRYALAQVQVMKIFFIVILSVFFLAGAKAQEPSTSLRHYDRGFAEYGNIRFSDEKLMFDHLALEFRKVPNRVIYLLVYSDWRSCQPQGKARALRAKNYLVKHHGIKPARVVWKDGGFQSDLSVEVWLLDRNEAKPEPVSILDQSRVKKMRQRRCRKERGRRV